MRFLMYMTRYFCIFILRKDAQCGERETLQLRYYGKRREKRNDDLQADDDTMLLCLNGT